VENMFSIKIFIRSLALYPYLFPLHLLVCFIAFLLFFFSFWLDMVGISATSLQYQALLLQCFCLMSNQVAKLVRVQLQKKKKASWCFKAPFFFKKKKRFDLFFFLQIKIFLCIFRSIWYYDIKNKILKIKKLF
jgi:hypothetical protein